METPSYWRPVGQVKQVTVDHFATCKAGQLFLPYLQVLPLTSLRPALGCLLIPPMYSTSWGEGYCTFGWSPSCNGCSTLMILFLQRYFFTGIWSIQVSLFVVLVAAELVGSVVYILCTFLAYARTTRWVCTSGRSEDLAATDNIALQVMEGIVAKGGKDTVGVPSVRTEFRH